MHTENTALSLIILTHASYTMDLKHLPVKHTYTLTPTPTLLFWNMNTNSENCFSCTHRNNEAHTKCYSLLCFYLNIDSTWQQEACHSPLFPKRQPLNGLHLTATRSPIKADHTPLTHTFPLTTTLLATLPQAIAPCQ